MGETQVPATSPSDTAAGEYRADEELRFTIGPPQPVTDPQALPAVSADEEAAFVSKANLGIEHPDTVNADPTDDVVDEDVAAEPPAEDDDDLVSDDELGALVADVDVDNVDEVGFDDSDLEEPLEIDITDAAGESVKGRS